MSPVTLISSLVSTPTTIAIVSSTNATPIVVTATNHGLTNGRRVSIEGHTVNINANGSWIIANVAASTLELKDSTGNGVGGATGTITDQAGAIRLSGVGVVNGPNLNASDGGQFGSKLSGFLEVLTASGTTPTLVVKVQYSYDGVNFTDLTSGAFAQLTTSNTRAELNSIALAGVPPVLRHVSTLGGTSPIFTFVIKLWTHD